MTHPAGSYVWPETSGTGIVVAAGAIVRAPEAAVELLRPARKALLVGRERRHRLVLAAMRGDAVGRRLMTVPGVGPVTAPTFRSAVDDPARFGRSHAVSAHAGLAPRRCPPGEIGRVGHLSQQDDGLARPAPCKAANVLLTRTNRWSALKGLGRLLAGRAWGDESGAPRPMGMGAAKRAGRRRAPRGPLARVPCGTG